MVVTVILYIMIQYLPIEFNIAPIPNMIQIPGNEIAGTTS